MNNNKKLQRTIIIIVVVAAIAVLGAYFIKDYQKQQKLAKKPVVKPVIVLFANAKTQIWQQQVHAIGTIAAMKGVTVKAEVPGHITKIYMESDTPVNQGEPLLEINPKILQAELAQRKANVKFSEFEFARNKILYSKNDVSLETLEKAKSQLDANLALLNNTQQQLILTTVRAPFTGTIGLKKVDLGDYVEAGTPLATLQAKDKLRVNFSIPEQYADVIKIGDKIEFSMGDRLNQVYTGEIYAINPLVDENSRMLAIRATIHTLKYKPGRYAHVSIFIGKKYPVITIPQTAVVKSLHGDYVYRVENAKAKKVFVKPGERRGDVVIIDDGLKPGDKVVSVGQMKLHDGVAVTDKDALMVKNP